MHDKIKMLCCWSGLMAVFCFFLGVVALARLLPPPISPTTPQAEVLAFYAAHRIGLLAGMVSLLWGSAFFLPLVAVISNQLRRIEGPDGVMANAQMVVGTVVGIAISLPAYAFSALAFRADRPAEITMLMSDISWILFVWPNPATSLLMLVIGIAMLADEKVEPLFPRWVGFYNIALALLYVPSCFATLFTTGPVAWNGILSFWTPAFEFGSWNLIMFFALRRAIRSDYRRDAST